MGGLALLARNMGHKVSGSDSNTYPPMSTLLAEHNVEVSTGYRATHLSPRPDLVVVGNALSRGNEEVEAMLEKRLPYTSGPEWLYANILKKRKVVAVAGTHGKTTTSAMLAHILDQCGLAPGFLIGGVPGNFGVSARHGSGDIFVVEADEYDSAFFDKGPKFLHYRPDASILTSIEFDHADIFNDLEQIKQVFRDYVGLIKPNGVVLVKSDDNNIREVIKSASCNIETYGYDEAAEWRIESYRFEKGFGHFSLAFKNQHRGDFELAMIGRHNVENAAAVAGLCFNLGLTKDEINEGFRTFKGVKRRQEIVGKKKGITVIDDFAHHPTAINLTIDAVKKAYPGQKVWAVFEPRSATSRRKVFEDSFPNSFLKADRVIFSRLFAPEKIKEEERLDIEGVAASICELGGIADYIPQVDDIVEFITKNSKAGNVILVMSSGGFGGIHQKILENL